MSESKLINVRSYLKHGFNEKNQKGPDPSMFESIADSLQWLKIHVTPWPEVISHWKTTLSLRQDLFIETASVQQYIEIFPCLANSDALGLVSFYYLFEADIP
jgi:hypothetical protein